MTWKIIHEFDQIKAIDLYRALKLRQDIFIIEQDCIYEDIDSLDLVSRHILLYDAESLVAYCRIVPGGKKFDVPSIGRVIVNSDYRNRGKGKELMEKALEILKAESVSQVVIEAQEYLESFYQSLGFSKRSEPYDVDGISHILMDIYIKR